MENLWYGIAGVVATLLLAALPLLKIYREWSNVKVTDAASGFYKNLSEQLRINSEALNAAYTERNNLIHKYAEMEVRMALLEEKEKRSESLIDTLTQKLDLREEELRAMVLRNEGLMKELNLKNDQIQEQNIKITTLTERIHQLELRLASDETSWSQK